MPANTVEPNPFAAIPAAFWPVVFFVFGSMVGSFLNVCIHRMPLGQSIVTPRSHCPHCKYSIPWYLNVPLFTWLFLQGRCANCKAPISFRYFAVELLTAVTFMSCWLRFGDRLHPLGTGALALAYCILLAGFIAATFIDFEHYIIPDEITLGGIVAGFLASAAVPALQGMTAATKSMELSFIGILAGAGLIYGILRLGKLLFGRQKVKLPPDSKVVFTETALQLPDETVPFEELFYRGTDYVKLHAKRLELVDRCCTDVDVRLTPSKLTIGEESFDPEPVKHMEAVTDQIILPREAMGLGDVKFMAAIGAFLGAPAVLFSLMVSAIIGSIVGVTLIALKKQEWSSRLPYGPYIALAATVWVFWGNEFVKWWFYMPR